MRVVNSYLLTVSSVLLFTLVILVMTGQDTLRVYYTFFVLGALLVTELFVHLNAHAKLALSRISLFLFTGFLIIVAQQILLLTR